MGGCAGDCKSAPDCWVNPPCAIDTQQPLFPVFSISRLADREVAQYLGYIRCFLRGVSNFQQSFGRW